MASRSYKDLMQYHVFPWILCEFGKDALNFSNSYEFRDLSYNMGSLGSAQRRNNYLERYNIIRPSD